MWRIAFYKAGKFQGVAGAMKFRDEATASRYAADWTKLMHADSRKPIQPADDYRAYWKGTS